MPDFSLVKKIAQQLPEAELGTSYGTPAIKVKKKLLCRLWGEREYNKNEVHDTEVLMIRCHPDAKEILLSGGKGTIFSTAHYDGYPSVLIRLNEVSEDQLRDLMEDAYREVAPPSLAELI